ncbi:MAG: SMP-30/gluconolactonase/LRE family protein [Planctomycetota bacterium]
MVVEMGLDRGCVTRISPDGQEKRVIAKTGRPNGLTVDKEAAIWVAESMQPSLLRLTMDGKKDVVITECDGKPFLFPNDLCFGPKGELYLTDSGIYFDDFVKDGKVVDNYKNLDYDGRVYRIDLQKGKIEQFDNGILFTNGIAFGPDNYLYVNETITGMIYRYRWQDGQIVGGREHFGNVFDPKGPDVMKGPDGMAFGQDRNLYCTVFGQADTTVLAPDGSTVKRIQTQGKGPTNVAFGLPGDKRIYVTEVEVGTIEVFEVDTQGLPLYA